MNRTELVELLKELAEKDLAEGTELFEHPCSVAVRAIEQCFEDIGVLRSVAIRKSSQSKRVQVLIASKYDPSW